MEGGLESPRRRRPSGPRALERLVFLGAFACSLHGATVVAYGEEREPSFTQERFAEQVLAYEPPHRDGIAIEEFERGRFYLEETRSATGGDPAKFNLGDYWNITMAFLNLGEPEAHVRIAFEKAIEDDPGRICAYVDSLGAGRLVEVIPETFLAFYEDACLGRGAAPEALDLDAYVAERGLSGELVRQIHEIGRDDQRYRNGQSDASMARQRELDRRNRSRIDSLYAQHRRYIGRSLVGEELEHVMWAVIQHSDVSTMERYLPIVAQAVRDGELKQIPLKMLIDRYYARAAGHQVFGSQVGVPLADPQTRARIRGTFGLE